MDDTALVSETLDIESGDGTADAFFTRPAGDGLFPGGAAARGRVQPAPGRRGARRAPGAARLLRAGAERVYRRVGAPAVDGLQEKMKAEDRAPLFELLRPMMGC